MGVVSNADYWATQTSIIEEIAQIKGWSETYTQNYWLNELTAAQRQELLASYGFTATTNSLGTINGYVRNAAATAEAGGNIVSGAAPQVMEVVESEGNVALQTVAQTTTATGKTIQAGGAMTALKVANGALIAAAIGGAVARDYKEHTDWWNDLSDAVFQQGEFSGINLGGTMPPVETDWNGVDAAIDTMRVINRRVEDSLGLSQNYTYMSASDLACIMQILATEGAYDPEGVDYPTPVVSPSISLQGDRSQIIDFAKHIVAMHNSRVATTTGVAIPLGYVEDFMLHLLAQAPSDYNCIQVQMSGVANYVSSGVIYFFKGTDNGYTTESSSGEYNARGFTGTAYYAQFTFYKNDPTHPSIQYNTRSTDFPITYGLYTDGLSTRSSNLNATYNAGGIPEQGIYPDPNAVPFAIGSAATIAEVIDALRTQYPDWWGEGFDLNTYDPNTNIFDVDRWLPVSIPWTNPNDAPYNIPDGYDQPYAQTGRPFPDPTTTPTGYGTPYPYPWDVPYTAPTVPYYFPNNPTPVPTDTPSSPSTPPVVTGSSNALWAVYNPTFSEVSAVGSYLWSSSIIDIVQKFFANPMDGIISLHMIYTTPTTGATQNIKLGYLDSGVSAKIVTNQYKIINCGEILVPEYFQDVRDYSPYTKCDIFLPFIGIRSLAPEDVINCKLKVKYTVDVLTGAILAELFITKRGATQCLYTFAGNGSVQIPLTGGDRTRLLSGIVAGVTATAGGAAVGGIAGMAAGAVHGVQGLHNSSSVERTGNFSANAGAMGIKKPYLIINRKDAYDAYNYNTIIGYPANIACRLSDCSGYTKINSVHVENIPGATENEKERILTVLRSGIIIQ